MRRCRVVLLALARLLLSRVLAALARARLVAVLAAVRLRRLAQAERPNQERAIRPRRVRYAMLIEQARALGG